MHIIPRINKDWQQQDWQTALSNVITDPAELLQELALDASLLPAARIAAQQFPLKVPYSFVARMKKGDVYDPLLRQVLPLHDELQNHAGYSVDPLQENEFNPLPGLLHKYYGRVLLTVAGICGINCRYCFRRHFPYEENNPGRIGWEKVLQYIAADQTISEVIFSGGDPLIASDKLLKELIIKIAKIPHVKTLRIHTRMPIVIPMRITETLIELMTCTHLRPVIVLHCNHPQEIDMSIHNAIQKCRDANITLLNQAVLLKGVNDNADVLIELSEKLFSCGILPYYLHLLDRAQNTAHFAVSEFTAQQLLADIMSKLPGYLVPKIVREVAGAANKMPIPYLENCLHSLLPEGEKE